MIEKRKYPRVRTGSGDVEVHIMGPGFLEVLAAEDISEGGIQVRCVHRFAGCDIGQPVELVLKLRGAPSFLARGKILHIRDKGEKGEFFGVKFSELTQKNRERLRSFVFDRLAKPVAAATLATTETGTKP